MSSSEELSHDGSSVDSNVEVEVSGEVTVGPVIGATTTTTTRILVEVNREGPLKFILKAGDEVHTRVVDMAANRPCIASFDGLTAGTTYALLLEGVNNADLRTGMVKTVPKKVKTARVAVVSCHDGVGRNVTIDSNSYNVWRKLEEKVKAGLVDLILHVGDQVYADSAFHDAMALKGSVEKNAAKIKELYRDVYRTTWSQEHVQQTLAHVPNICQWDDHELRDDWGCQETDWDPETKEFAIGVIAREVFWEYQRALRDESINPSVDSDGLSDMDDTEGLEHFAFTVGEVGVVMLDQRGGRSFHRATLDAEDVDTGRFLSEAQWDDVTSMLDPANKDSPLAGAKMLLMVTTCPLVFLSSEATTLLGKKETLNDLKDHWSYGAHVEEQEAFLDLLTKWKASKKTREVCVVGGDVHIGGTTTIKQNGNEVFKQVVASPILGPRTSWFSNGGNLVFNRELSSKDSKYTYKHDGYRSVNNFAILNIDLSQKVPSYTVDFVYGSGDRCCPPSCCTVL